MAGGHRDKNREDTQKRVSSLPFLWAFFLPPLVRWSIGFADTPSTLALLGREKRRGSPSFSLPPSFCFAKIHLPRQREVNVANPYPQLPYDAIFACAYM